MISARLRWRLKTHRRRTIIRYRNGPWRIERPSDRLAWRADRRALYMRISSEDDSAPLYWARWLKRSIRTALGHDDGS